jgi:alpha-galactosidase
MARQILILLMVAGCCCSGVLAGASVPVEWRGISVDVQADHPVDVSQKMIPQKNGLHRLEIRLSNPGDEMLTISKITVHVPLPEPPAPSMQMLYGSSGMGRRPLLRQEVGRQNRRSSSFMYELIQMAENRYLFAGAVSWRTFIPVFTLQGNQFVIQSDGEGKQLAPKQSVDYERLVFADMPGWIDLLDLFGSEIARENGVQSPRDISFKGWATWDYYGRTFTEEAVRGNVDELIELAPDATLVQIDGGWWTERGDYTSVRSDLVGGIKQMVSCIRDQGMITGLHFDGFRGDTVSELYRAHPDYFLHDQDGRLIVQPRQKVDREMNYIFFDYSHPGLRRYIADCIRVMKEDWGIRYFKVDFMRYGLEQDLKNEIPGVESIRAYDPQLTGVERFRLGMKTIREAIGPDNYFLGCSAVFGPAIGFVDGMRTGGDIHPRFEAFPERCLANAGNWYLKKVFNMDADYLVFREAADEDRNVSGDQYKSGGSMSLSEATMWADFISIFGNCRLSSDNLMTLRPERKTLVRSVFDAPVMDEMVPLDTWRHAQAKSDGFELLLARKGSDIYLGVFNWSDQEKTYRIPGFSSQTGIVLGARHSKILKYGGSRSFDELCRSLSR